MTKQALTRCCVILAAVVFVFILINWGQLWHHFGWDASTEWHKENIVLPVKDGMPVIASHQRLILQRQGTEVEIAADPTGREILEAVPEHPKTTQQPRRPPAPQPRAAAPCDPQVSQTGCPPASSGLKLIKRRN